MEWMRWAQFEPRQPLKADDFPLPAYLEELLEELDGPLLREDVERGRSREVGRGWVMESWPGSEP